MKKIMINKKIINSGNKEKTVMTLGIVKNQDQTSYVSKSSKDKETVRSHGGQCL